MKLEEAIRPNDWFFLAMSYHHLGDSDKAGEYFDRAVQSYETFKSQLPAESQQELDAYRVEAERVLSGGGKLPASVLHWTLLARLCPLHPEPYHQRAHVYEALGQYHEAMADFTAALLRQPENDAARAAHLYHSRGVNYRRVKDYSHALADLQKALDLHPSGSQACWDLAWLYVMGPAEVRAPKIALPLAKRAVAQDPERSANHWLLGALYYRLGEWNEAVACFQEGLRSRQERSTAAYDFLWAMCCAKLGDNARAKQHFDQAVRWYQDRNDILDPQLVEELEALRVEAEEVLRATAPSASPP